MTPATASPTELRRRELFDRYDKVRAEVGELYQWIEALGGTPLHLRREKFEKLHTELVAKLDEGGAIREELLALSFPNSFSPRP